MTVNYNHEPIPYLPHCYYSIKQQARDIALAYYQKLDLERLPPLERSPVLSRVLALHLAEEEAFDNQLYLSHADDPDFLDKHFGDNGPFFSVPEQGKYLEAQVIREKTHLLQQLQIKTDIQVEKQELEDKMSKDRMNGLTPDSIDIGHLKYLERKLQRCQGTEEARPGDLKGTQARGRKKKNSFGYHAREELLCLIVDELTVEVGFLRRPTTTSDFIRVATTKNLASMTTLICMGCQNNQIIYIMEWFQSLFYSFDAATIGNSRLFISKEGHVLKAHNLNSTVCTHVKKRYHIDAIFKKYGVKRLVVSSKFTNSEE